MKKILLFVFITLIFVQNVYAECDYNNEVELTKLASKINYDYEYDKEHNTFTYHIYNVNDRLYLMNNSMMIKPEDNKVTIYNVKEGEYLNLPVKSLESCYESLMTLYIIVPYFNEFYNSAECKGYEDKLKICKDEFLSFNPDINILNDAIYNYNNSISNTKVEQKEEQKITLVDKLETFAKTWGIKIGLSLFTIIICVTFFQIKIRKIKHGL